MTSYEIQVLQTDPERGIIKQKEESKCYTRVAKCSGLNFYNYIAN